MIQEVSFPRNVLGSFNEGFTRGLEFCIFAGVEPRETNEDVDQRSRVMSISETVFAATRCGKDWRNGLYRDSGVNQTRRFIDGLYDAFNNVVYLRQEACTVAHGKGCK